MSTMLDHPDITSACRTGWPSGASGENRDTLELRVEFAKDHPKELVEFLLAGDADLIDSFVEHYCYQYKNWLN